MVKDQTRCHTKQLSTANTLCKCVHADGTIFIRYSKHHSKATENNGSLTGDDTFIYDKGLENRKKKKTLPFIRNNDDC